MPIVKQMQVLIGLALLSAASVTLADTEKPEAPASTPAAATASASPDAVVVVGTSQGSWSCDEATRERARWLADRASRDGEYQRAGRCYLAAGEQALADQAFVKASLQASPDTSRRLAANLDEVKAQARLIKQAFQRR